MRNSTVQGRRGFAMLTVIGTIMIISLVAVPISMVVRSSTGMSIQREQSLRAVMGAEGAVWRLIGNFDSSAHRSIGIYDGIIAIDSQELMETQTFITRVDTSIYWIVGSAKIGKGRHETVRKFGLSAEYVKNIGDTIAYLKPLPVWGWVKLY